MSEWTHRYVSTRRADSVAREYGRARAYVRVEAGLHHIKGNARPYFAVTADAYSPGHPDSPFVCGQMPETVARLWPKLAPVVRLHLSDDTGQPMHAVENGWYWLAGFYGGAGERFHGANTTPAHDALACLQIFAEHVRVPLEQAGLLAAQWKPIDGTPWAATRALFAAWIETQRERWQAEADAAIALLDQLAAKAAAK